MLWASLAVPIVALASTEDGIPPASEQAPTDPTPPVSETSVLAEDTQPSAETSAPTDDSSSDKPQLEISGDQNVLTAIQQLSDTQDASGSRSGNTQMPRMLPTNPSSTGGIPGMNGVSAPANSAAGVANSPWTVRYTGKHMRMQLGDIPVELGGNSLATLNRSVRGLQIDATLPKGTLTGVVSDIQTPTQNDTFTGQGNSGPYALSMSPVSPGSDVVKLNGISLVREIDYSIDYTAGTLTFIHGRIVTTTDQVTVTYRVVVNGTGGGKLMALRGSYPVSKNLTVGVTHIGLKEQKSTGNTVSEKRDRITSRNLPGPFFLSYHPIVTNSEIVTASNRTLQRNIAYTLDYASGKLQFRQGYIPSYGTTVDIRYRVTSPETDNGNRSVNGMDVDWKDGKGLGVNIQAAVSSGGTQPIVTATAQSIMDEQFTIRQGSSLIQQVFRLQKSPIREGSESVRALSRTLVRNQDYSLNYQTGELRLLNSSLPKTPNGSMLFVSYDTKPVTQKPAGNSAMAATLTYNKGKVNAMARYQKMGAGFAPLDIGTGTTAQRATEWSASYAPSSAVTLSTSGGNSLSAVDQLLGSASGQSQLLQQNRAYVLDFHKPNLPTVTVQHITQNSNQVTDKRIGDQTTSDNISVSWNKQALTATATLDRTTSKSNQPSFSFSGDGTAQKSNAISTSKNTVNSASLNLGYHPSEKMDVAVNLSTNKLSTDTDGSVSKTGGKSIQANATYRPKENLSLTASLQQNTSDPVKADGAILTTTQKNRNLSLNANWQAKKHVNVGVNYMTSQDSGGDFGANKTSTISANVGWQASTKTAVNGFVASQQLQSPGVSGKSRSTLAGISAQTSLLRNTTLNVSVQRVKGQNGDGVNQLWQTQAQSVAPASIGLPSTNSNSLTAVTGSLNYQLGSKQDLRLNAGILKGRGQSGSTRQKSLGLGWHYHANDKLTFSLDANRVSYRDSGNPGQNLGATELNAALTWHF